MIKINFKDGTTLDFDLDDVKDATMLQEWLSANDFQGKITGINILYNKKLHALPVPKRFKQVRWYAEPVFKTRKGLRSKVGERISCHCDHILISMMVYTIEPAPPLAVVTKLEKVGKQMFNDNVYHIEPVS